jgi:hypothetical protein
VSRFGWAGGLVRSHESDFFKTKASQTKRSLLESLCPPRMKPRTVKDFLACDWFTYFRLARYSLG